ncbi:MAG: Flp pilus assembly protein CpaB [Anaerolineae bacterium]|nr:Flp pilus assembly protein CpaB [Anaerolineae bacterium]
MGAGRGRRTGMVLIFIIIIMLVAVLAVVYFMLQPSTGENGETAEQPGDAPTATPLPVTVEVIVAARDLPRGTRLSLQDVTTVSWPDTVARPNGALELRGLLDSAGLEQIEGRIARTDILSGQPVLDHMLTPGDQPTDFSETGSDAALLIPSGRVAIAVPLNRLSGVAYALRAGDHVDIMVSFRFVDVDEDFQTILPNNVGLTVVPVDMEMDEGIIVAGREEEGPFGIDLMVVPSEISQRPRQVTQLLIDNVTVLRVGTFSLSDVDRPIVIAQTPEPQATAEEMATDQPAEGVVATATPVPQVVIVPDIITLIMTPQDALVLKYAFETGADIDFALRSVLDKDVDDVETASVTLQYIIDFYGVAIPPRMSIASEPRIDLMMEQTGVFTPMEPVATPVPEEPSS